MLTNEREHDLTVSRTIASQLGGTRRLILMIGARDFRFGESGLSFCFKARAKNGANALNIRLAPSDTYVVEFVSARGLGWKVKSKFENIYADDLVRLIENETGLFLRI